MAKNPFVDGIKNLAIPDAPYGVNIANCKISGSLYGIEAVVGKSAHLERVNVGRSSNLTGMQIEGEGFFEKMQVKGDANFECMSIGENAYFKQMRIGGRALFYGMSVTDIADFTEFYSNYASFSGIKVRLSAYFSRMIVEEVHFDGAAFEGDADFDYAHIGKLNTEEDGKILIVHGHLNLEGTIVQEFAGRIAAKVISGTPRKIPKSMHDAIEKAVELYASLPHQEYARD